MAAIPVGAARFTVGIQLGGLCEWVQVEDAVFHDVEVFGKPGKKGPTVPAQLIHEGMEETDPGLFRCSCNALTLAPPTTGTGDPAMLPALGFPPETGRGWRRGRVGESVKIWGRDVSLKITMKQI